MTTTPTSGAADLPKALRLADAITKLMCSTEAAARTLAAAADELVRLHAESEMRRAALLDEMQKAALAAGQAVAQDDLITIRKPTTSAEMLWLLKLAHLVISDVDKTLEESFAPAHPAAQADTQPAPVLEVELSDSAIDAIVFHQTGFDGDGTQPMTIEEMRRVVRAARAPEDSVPKAQFDDPKVQAVYAILCDDADWPPKENSQQHWEGWIARRIVDTLLEDSVLEDAARYRWLREHWFTMSSNYQCRITFKLGEPRWSDITEAELDAAIDAARKQGEKQ